MSDEKSTGEVRPVVPGPAVEPRVARTEAPSGADRPVQEGRTRIGAPETHGPERAGDVPQMPDMSSLPPEIQEFFSRDPATFKPKDHAEFAKRMGADDAEIKQLLRGQYPDESDEVLDKAIAEVKNVEPLNRSVLSTPGAAGETESETEQSQMKIDPEEAKKIESLGIEAQALLPSLNDPTKKEEVTSFVEKVQKTLGDGKEVTLDVLMKIVKGGTIGIGLIALILILLTIMHSPRARQ